MSRVAWCQCGLPMLLLVQGVASAEDIDLAMKKGTHQHMGPLHLADYIGLDTCLNIMRVLHSGIGEDKYRPCPMLTQLVDAGALGRWTLSSGRCGCIHNAAGLESL